MIDKATICQHFDRLAPSRPQWFRKNHLYHQQIIEVCTPFLNPDSRILELGCSTGDLLNALQPGFGLGVDFSAHSIEVAQQNYPHLHWLQADVEALPQHEWLAQPFDIIIMADLVGYLDDIQTLFINLQPLCHSGTRLIISHWNWMWQPLLKVAEALNLKAPDLAIRQNWLSSQTIQLFLHLSDYQPLQALSHLCLPYQLPPFSTYLNAFSQTPVFKQLSLLKTVVARPMPPALPQPASVTVVIPTRNELENIAAAVARTPMMGKHTELLFIDGNSTDGTVEAIQEQIAAHPELDIRFMPQVPARDPDSDTPPNLMLKLGKGDAVRKAFSAAKGDIVMILDSDLTVPPEELPRFYDALTTGKGRFINGTRFVYQQELGAMPPLNRLGNVFFSYLFSWLLGQRITDTLCGTKVLYKSDYEEIAANRHYFGDFDPFGDFDLLFGAARLRYPLIEVPIHYKSRRYGDSKVRVGLHGPLLGRMALIALWQFKVRSHLPGQAHLPPPIPSPEAKAELEPDSAPKLTGWLILAFFLAVFTALRRKSHD